MWSIGPYITHRLFNPDLPLSIETGAEVTVDYKFTPSLMFSTSLRKSVLTNLTENQRRASSIFLPQVHTDWPLYDIAGQEGHIHDFSLSYRTNLSPNLYSRFHFGLLEPFLLG